MRGSWAIAALGLGAACIPTGQFECEQDAQCSRQADGLCQLDGFCSYPDQTCESGHRYSGFAGPVSGTCVSLGGSGSSSASASSGPSSSVSADSGSSSDDGPLPSSCDGVDCSGAGTCVMVDDEPTCACDPGLYPVGLSCLEDPCQTHRCFFVDAQLGDDMADGSREAPWQTLGRLMEAFFDAEPGDHFLLRRGDQWSMKDGGFRIWDVTGTTEAPVVVGAYGPLSDPRPRLVNAAALMERTQHLVLRDLRFEQSGGPCVRISESEYIVVQGNEIDLCSIRGIRVDRDSHHTVIIDNLITNSIDHAGIFVADTTWEPGEVDSHHWIVDNVVVASAVDGIDVNDARPNGEPGDYQPVRDTTDVKVIGNTVVDAGRWGVKIDIQGHAWIVGNTVVRNSGTEAGGILTRTDGILRGNVVLRTNTGIELGGAGEMTHNTVVQQGAGQALEITTNSVDRVITDNLLLARDGARWVDFYSEMLTDNIEQMDRNWYATDGEECMFRLDATDVDLMGLLRATGFDAASVCASVPGLGSIPIGLLPEDLDGSLVPALTPDADWERCDDPAGALDCQGQPVGKQIDPIAGLDDNGGLGWAGPLIVRQRYDTSP